jgi:hypothetical protein
MVLLLAHGDLLSLSARTRAFPVPRSKIINCKFCQLEIAARFRRAALHRGVAIEENLFTLTPKMTHSVSCYNQQHLRRRIIVFRNFMLLVCFAECLSLAGCSKSGEDLTGAQAVARLTAKGWEPMVPPSVIDKGSAKTTTFMSKPPKPVTIMIMEYNSSRIGHAAYDAIKGPDSALYGDTIVMVSGGTPELRQKALNDIKP